MRLIMRGDEMGGLYEWIRGIVFYLILMTMILNLLPDKKYEKYLRLFTGVVFILLVFGPFANVTGLEERIAGAFERLTFQNDVKLLQRELADMDGERLSRMMESYREAVETDLATMAEGLSVRCLEVTASLDMDPESDGYGSLVAVKMWVGLPAAASGEIQAQRLAANREIASLKKKIGEYYGLEERKITIDLEDQ